MGALTENALCYDYNYGGDERSTREEGVVCSGKAGGRGLMQVS